MSDSQQIPDGKPYMVGRDFTAGERSNDLPYYLEAGQAVLTGDAARARIAEKAGISVSWPLTQDDRARVDAHMHDTAQRFRESMEAIRASFAKVDFAGAAESIREFTESYRQAQEAESAPHPLHPAIKKPSRTPPPWAVNVGKAKRNPRSTRRVK